MGDCRQASTATLAVACVCLAQLGSHGGSSLRLTSAERHLTHMQRSCAACRGAVQSMQYVLAPPRRTCSMPPSGGSSRYTHRDSERAPVESEGRARTLVCHHLCQVYMAWESLEAHVLDC